MYIGGIN